MASSQPATVTFRIPPGGVFAGTNNGLYFMSVGTNSQWIPYSAFKGMSVTDVTIDTQSNTIWVIANGNLYNKSLTSSAASPWTLAINGSTWNNLSGESPGFNYDNSVVSVAYNPTSNLLWIDYGNSIHGNGLFTYSSTSASWKIKDYLNWPLNTPLVEDPATGGVDTSQVWENGQGGGVLVVSQTGSITYENGYDGFPSTMAILGLGMGPTDQLFVSACELDYCQNSGSLQAGIYQEPSSTANSWSFVAAGIYPRIFRYDPSNGMEYGLASNGLYVDNGGWSLLSSVTTIDSALAYSPLYKGFFVGTTSGVDLIDPRTGVTETRGLVTQSVNWLTTTSLPITAP